MRKNITDMARLSVSVVVPCYNEKDALPQTCKRLLEVASGDADHDYEFVFVDDGSTDQTLAILRDLAEGDERVRVLSFSRNFGHQIAATAGIDAAVGDCVVLIDADLQDPPENILQMLELWKEGYDVVYAVRRKRLGETRFKLATARSFYRVLSNLSDVPIPLDTGDFRLMSRPVVDVLKAMPEKHRFLRGMVSWAGFRQTPLPYDREERKSGVSKYPLNKMIRFASDGIVSFSTKPLRIATGLGIFASLLAIMGIVYAIFLRIFTSIWVEGWTALMIAVLFLGGVQLLSLGIIGEYLGRVYEESKGRPMYILRERIGFENQAKMQKQPSREEEKAS